MVWIIWIVNSLERYSWIKDIYLSCRSVASVLVYKQNIIIIMASSGNKFYIRNGVKMSGKPGEKSFTFELPDEQKSILTFLVVETKSAVLKAIHHDRMKMGSR